MPEVKPPKLYINLAQAAEYLGFSNTQRVTRMIARREIKAQLIRNENNSRRNRWRVDFDSVREWHEKNTA